MTDILINGLSCNNTSSQTVIKSHILNILQLSPRTKITLCLSQCQSLLWQSFFKNIHLSLNLIVFPAWLFSLPIPRWIIHSFLFTICTYILQPRCVILSNGYPLPIFFIRQVVICQNPVPFLPPILQGDNFNPITSLSFFSNRFLSFLFIKYLHLTRKTSLFSLGYAFNSRYMYSLYRSFNAVPPDWKVVYNPISANKARLVRSKYRRPDPTSSVVILSVAPLIPYKGVHLLVESVVKLIQTLPSTPISLISVGSAPDKAYLTSIQATIPHDLQDRFNFITHYLTVSELDSLFYKSDIYCSMSVYESFGLPAVEAQSYGLPVVLYKHTAASEVCHSGSLLCEDLDPDKLFLLLRELVTSPSLWCSLSSRALANSQRFTNENISAGLLDLSCLS